MKTFSYVIKSEIGIHARPAGLLVQLANRFESEIVIQAEGRKAEADRLMEVLKMDVKNGEATEVFISGPDEEKACESLKTFFEENL